LYEEINYEKNDILLLIVVSIVMSIITYIFAQQSDRIDVLENRIKDLEDNK
jgi:hypothetical protein